MKILKTIFNSILTLFILILFGISISIISLFVSIFIIPFMIISWIVSLFYSDGLTHLTNELNKILYNDHNIENEINSNDNIMINNSDKIMDDYD